MDRYVYMCYLFISIPPISWRNSGTLRRPAMSELQEFFSPVFLCAIDKVVAIERKRLDGGWREPDEPVTDPKVVRTALGLTQDEFHVLFGLDTRQWEQKRRSLSDTVKVLLSTIHNHPIWVVESSIEERLFPRNSRELAISARASAGRI
jgi:hypothetical protein